MKLSPLRTSLIAILISLCLWFIVLMVNTPTKSLLINAEFQYGTISPNADNINDITAINYSLSRPANVSIYFMNKNEQKYYFRESKPRQSGQHTLLFSGVVNGFQLPGENIEGKIISRTLPNDEYTWIIEANDNTSIDRKTGQINVILTEDNLPDIKGFSVSPSLFTPNRDGISDRVWINLFLSKNADIEVNLIDANGISLPIAERAGTTPANKKGFHTFEYEGGVDLGVSPPLDGTYKVIAKATDKIGQKTSVDGKLDIKYGGIPRADIVNADIEFSETTIVQGNQLKFSMTIENYGSSPIRTTGPEPGFTYSQNENANTHGWYEESGAWRVGIDCDTCIRDYPWRWSLGTKDELTKIDNYWYLMPGQRTTVTGTIKITDIPARNPLYFWGGLIHEDVEISNINNRVDPHFIHIIPNN